MKKENSNIISLTDRQLDLIERLGVFSTSNGMQPAPARIYGLLLVCDKLELTFDEIRETLAYSKSATSNGINFLLTNKKISYVTKTGDRKRYFKTNVESWKDYVGEGFNYVHKYHLLMNEVVEVRTAETENFNNSLQELTNFLGFVKEEISRIFEKWENHEEKKNEN